MYTNVCGPVYSIRSLARSLLYFFSSSLRVCYNFVCASSFAFTFYILYVFKRVSLWFDFAIHFLFLQFEFQKWFRCGTFVYHGFANFDLLNWSKKKSSVSSFRCLHSFSFQARKKTPSQRFKHDMRKKMQCVLFWFLLLSWINMHKHNKCTDVQSDRVAMTT